MNRPNRKAKQRTETGVSAPPAPTYSSLNITPDEVSAHISSRGWTKESILRDFAVMERRLGLSLDEFSKSSSGAKLQRDYRLDSFPGQSQPGDVWGQVKLVDVARELVNQWDEPGFDTIALDTTTTPKTGDLVLVRQFGENLIEVVRRLHLFPNGQARLDPVMANAAPSECAHISTFVVCGIVVGRAI